jgi:transposase InsO family protein
MCKVLKVSRSGYYDWLSRDSSPRKLDELKLARIIEDIHQGSRKTYGSPRIHRQLKALGVPCSRSRVERTMKKFGIRAKTKRKYRATTDSKHSFPVAKNLLARKFDVPTENKVWVADITAIWTEEGWLYLAALLDLFSRKVVGWRMSDRMTRGLTMEALEMAIKRRKPGKGLLHHSDRGSQYASDDYQALLTDHGMVCSMSRKGNCWDNAPMESFFHTLKTEHVYWERYATREQATRSISIWIETFYNRTRLHSTLDYKSPDAYESGLAA